MRSRRWTGSSGTVVERRSSTVGGSLRTAYLRLGESSIGPGRDGARPLLVPDPGQGRRTLAAVPEWRNGRRDRLKIDCPQGREGSNPSSGTSGLALDGHGLF